MRKFKTKRYKRRRSFRSSNWAPVLQLFGTLLGIAGFAAFMIFYALPKLLPLVGIDYVPPFSPTPTPVATPAPTPTPHPIATADLDTFQKELVFASSQEYQWFADPYFHKDKMVFTAGKLINGSARMISVFKFDIATQEATELPLKLENDNFMYPVFNDKWFVYFDALNIGGGYIKLLKADDLSVNPAIIKKVYTGQPELKLDGDYLAWTERTGTRTDKLFVCDLNTLETAAVQMFSDSVYGTSMPFIQNGLLIWADADQNGVGSTSLTSVINYIRINSSSIETYAPGTFIHDPETNGKHFVWLDGNHGPYTKLYCSAVADSKAKLIDSGVVEFGVGSDFVVYSKDERIWIYLFENGNIYPITPEREKAQFLGTSDDYVAWIDVTSRERDIVKYAKIP